ncbi:MAG: hypothetical protein RBT52_07240 [Sulfurimonas sp.]|jgi:hypothetical protein|nr:hypothetical protein [Sulfurimonas sp.]
MSVRLVKAPVNMAFSQLGENKEEFLVEYRELSENTEDPVSQWLKLARAKGETVDTDPILLSLIVELHRKVDALERSFKDEKPKRLTLENEISIESIGFEHLKLSQDILQEGVEYYGRVDLPVYPKRDIAIFFSAIDKSLAKITKMHQRDERDWGAYLTSRERLLIREARESRE